MKNSAPPGMVHMQTVEVNGLSYQKAWQNAKHHMTVGVTLQLLKVDNPLDANAVAVMWRGDQIGWVPKLCNHDIAAALRKGQTLAAFVSSCTYSALCIEVFRPNGPERSAEFDLHLCRQVVTDLEFGGLYDCYTTATRTSITICDDRGDLYWFRKSELPSLPGNLSEMLVKIVSVDPPRGQLVRKSAAEREVATALKAARPKNNQLRYTPETTFGVTAEYLTTQKEPTMLSNLITKTIDTNKSAAAQAAYLEAGRIATNKLAQVASKSLPLMARGYADTPLGRLLLANAALAAAAQLRPNDPTLAKLTQAMVTSSYQEAFQHLDIEGMLDNFLGTEEIKQALGRVKGDE